MADLPVRPDSEAAKKEVLLGSTVWDYEERMAM